jgi:hypothetical protein
MKLEITELEKEMLMAMGTDFIGFCLAHNSKEKHVTICSKCPVYNLCYIVGRDITVADWLAKNAEVIDKKEKQE